MTPQETRTTFSNPVYRGSFPDPFVLRFRGEYFAYCTGHAPDGNVFGVLRSHDLVNWESLPGALEPLDLDAPFYWAPEVTYFNGKFYLYYSVGDEVNMHLRVAVSDHPAGPFLDSRQRLSSEQFAIDAHVFRDDDGSWFMFYATDFLEHSHIGTGTVIDRMVDPFTLAGDPRPVTRAKYDWQVYDPARKEKGGVRWHTVEGPYVLKRKGIYFEMFSGGNWQNVSYGVSFAVTDDIDSESEWHQFSDGQTVLPILRTIPEKVIGPGHNSVILGPDARHLYCAYHRWQNGERVLCVDRMDFAGPDRIFIDGPTDSPQPVPFKPSLASGTGLGEWQDIEGSMVSPPSGRNEMKFDLRTADLLFAVGTRPEHSSGTYGVSFRLVDNEVFAVIFSPAENAVFAEWSGSGGPRRLDLPSNIDVSAYHELRLELIGHTISVTVDGGGRLEALLPVAPAQLVLYSDNCSVEFSAPRITRGFEEIFVDSEVEKRGWDTWANHGRLVFNGKTLLMIPDGDQPASIGKSIQGGEYELTINLRIVSVDPDGGAIFLGSERMFSIDSSDKFYLVVDENRWALPDDLDLSAFHQFHFLRTADEIAVSIEGRFIGSCPTGEGQQIEVAARKASIELDMVRYIDLSN